MHLQIITLKFFPSLPTFPNKILGLKKANRSKGRGAKLLAYVRKVFWIGQQGCQASTVLLFWPRIVTD
jgi:hypothetical protein